MEKANNLQDLKELKIIYKYFFLNCRTLNENNSLSNRNYMQDNYFSILGPILNNTLD